MNDDDPVLWYAEDVVVVDVVEDFVVDVDVVVWARIENWVWLSPLL